MKNKANFIAILAFLAGFASFQMYTSKLKAEATGGQLESVLIVTQDLEPGALLTRENLSATNIPQNYLDPRRIRAEELPNLLGVEIEKRLRAGEGLVWSDLTDGAAHKHLAALLTPGRRAYAVESDANPLGRLLRVADHVDVMLEAGGKTSTLVERVLVLAVGGHIERQEETLVGANGQGSGVTLSVTPEEAKQLLAAEAQGQLRLVLRNPEDKRRASPSTSRPPNADDASATSPQPETPKVEIEHVH